MLMLSLPCPSSKSKMLTHKLHSSSPVSHTWRHDFFFFFFLKRFCFAVIIVHNLTKYISYNKVIERKCRSGGVRMFFFLKIGFSKTWKRVYFRICFPVSFRRDRFSWHTVGSGDWGRTYEQKEKRRSWGRELTERAEYPHATLRSAVGPWYEAAGYTKASSPRLRFW